MMINYKQKCDKFFSLLNIFPGNLPPPKRYILKIETERKHQGDIPIDTLQIPFIFLHFEI